MSSNLIDFPSKSSFAIKISLTKNVQRNIMISANATLFSLHVAIISAFDFFDDHAHVFFLDNILWSDKEEGYYSEYIENEERYSKNYRLFQVLKKGQKFKYVFDFGDDWIFQCEVLKEINEFTEKPYVVFKKGKAPLQYNYLGDGPERE